MKRNFLLAVSAAVFLSGCRSGLTVSSVTPAKNNQITAEIQDDKGVNAVVAPYKAQLESKMNSKISHVAFDLTKQGDNSSLGNLLADFTFEGAVEWSKKNNLPATDAAVINIGGIRSTIGAGDILLNHIFEVMPFENELVIVKIKGTDVQGLFDYYLQTQKNNPVSRLYIETENGKLIQQLIGGSKISENKTYYLATSDYLALGGDNMAFFSKGEIINTGVKVRDLYIEKFSKMPEVQVPTDVRLKFTGKKQEK